MFSNIEATAENDLLASIDNNLWSFPILMSDELGANILDGVNNQVIIHNEVLLPPLTPLVLQSSPPEMDGKGKGKILKEKESDKPRYDRHIWVERERRSKMKRMFSELHALIPQVSPKVDKSTIVVEAVQYIKDLEMRLSNLQKQKSEKLKGTPNYTVTGCHPSPITAKNKLPVQQPWEGFLADVVASATNLSPTINVSTKPNVATSGLLADVVASASNSPAVTLASHNVAASAAMAYPTTFKTWSSPYVQLNMSGKDGYVSICCPREAKEVLTIVSHVMGIYMLSVVMAQVSVNEGARICMIHAQANVAYEFFTVETRVFVEEIFKQAANEINDWIIKSS